MRTTWILSMLVVSGCSVIASGKAGLGGGNGGRSTSTSTSSPSSSATPSDDDRAGTEGGKPTEVADASLEREREDPPDVGAALDRLKKLHENIKTGDFASYARDSSGMQITLLLQNGWKGEKKHDLIQRRLEELDAMAFKAFGGRVAANVGNGKRVLEVDKDAVEAATEMLDACRKASNNQLGGADNTKQLATDIAAYEKAIARVKKLEPDAFRFLGDVDVPAKLLECEVRLMRLAGDFEDAYVPEVAGKFELEKGCGAVDFLIDGVQIGSGRFAPYTRTVGGRQGLERTPCNKLAKRNKYPKPMAAAVKEFAADIEMKLSDLVITVKGPAYIEVDDDDLTPHRYQLLTAYSKKFVLGSNPCGKGKTFCEAGGSRGAAAFNKVEHALERAAVHAGKSPDRCRTFLKTAKTQAEWFAQFRDDAIKSKDWISGATYKTKKGTLLKEKDFVAAFAKRGEQAQEMLDTKYCARPAK